MEGKNVKFLGKHRLVPIGMEGTILKEIKGNELFVAFNVTGNPELEAMGIDPDNSVQVTFIRPAKEFEVLSV